MSYDDTLELKMPAEALQAFLIYKATPAPDRSLRNLAESWVTVHGGKAASRRRQLDRWSAKYAWQDLVKAWDKAKAAEKATQYSVAGEAFDSTMISAGEGILGVSIARLKEMIDEDARRHASYLALMRAVKPGTKPPARPRPQVGPMVLAQLLNWGASESRQAHASRLARVGGLPDDFGATGEEWPDVVEVSHSLAPPPEPADPDEGLDEPDELGDSGEPIQDFQDDDMPPAMVRLTTQRPHTSPYDEEDED